LPSWRYQSNRSSESSFLSRREVLILAGDSCRLGRLHWDPLQAEQMGLFGAFAGNFLLGEMTGLAKYSKCSRATKLSTWSAAIGGGRELQGCCLRPAGIVAFSSKRTSLNPKPILPCAQLDTPTVPMQRTGREKDCRAAVTPWKRGNEVSCEEIQ
jgi:hypothetical protein